MLRSRLVRRVWLPRLSTTRRGHVAFARATHSTFSGKLAGELWKGTAKLAEGVSGGDRACLSRAITLIESTRRDHNEQAELLMDSVLSKRKATASEFPGGLPSFRLGIAGPPGAGKSTFIEALGLMLLERGHKVAVLAVDPSSHRTGGSILGDKTRMMELSRRDGESSSPTRNAEPPRYCFANSLHLIE